MERETDVFIIGGGPAGLAAAIAARLKGFRVIVADGAKPPIDKACGEGLLPDALSALGRLGVFIGAMDGSSVRGIRFLDGGATAGADFPNGRGLGVRRVVLHQKMMERASGCGVSFLWNTPVTGIDAEGVAAGGKRIRARWIIGADGSRSRVRRWSGLEEVTQEKQRFAFRRHYRVRPWSEWAEIHWGDAAQAYVTPVSNEEICAVLISAKANMRFDEALREFPKLQRQIESAPLQSSERGAITAMHDLKRVWRGNVALIGDASGSVDAITGEGLSLSFCQASALADALQAGDLASYQRAHRRLSSRPTFMSSLMLLLAAKRSLRKRIMRAWEKTPHAFARMLAFHVGAASPWEMATSGAIVGWQFLTA